MQKVESWQTRMACPDPEDVVDERDCLMLKIRENSSPDHLKIGAWQIHVGLI
jgi:hypothetical protein